MLWRFNRQYSPLMLKKGKREGAMSSESKPEFGSYTSTELRELYEKDPELFNELSADAIRRGCIGSTPEQTLKLRQMQWVIDSKLRKGKTPLQRMHIMENIFYEQVYGDDGQLTKLITGWNKLLGAMNITGHISRNKC